MTKINIFSNFISLLSETTLLVSAVHISKHAVFHISKHKEDFLIMYVNFNFKQCNKQNRALI